MADFLTRLAERTLNRVPVAQPMIASVFAPEPTLPGFLPQAEAWSPLEQTQEVTTVSPAVPEIEVPSAINERQEVPTPFTPITPKPSPIIAEQEEQAGATPTVISQDKAAKPGRRGDHKGQQNIGKTDTGVQGDYQGRSYIEKPDIVEQDDHQGRLYTEESKASIQGDYQGRSYNDELGVGVQGDHKGHSYNDELSAIPSQRLIADQPLALTGQLSLYAAPAAPGLPVEENEPGIAARHEATDPIRMKMEHTEVVSPVADIASLIEAQAGISPREASITSRDEDMVLPLEISNGEEGFHRPAESPHAPVHFHDDSYSRGPAATPQGDHKSPFPTSTSSPAPTMTTRSPGDTSVTIVGRGPLWPPVVGEQDEADAGPTAGDHKGPLPSSEPLPPLLAERLFPKKPIPEGVGLPGLPRPSGLIEIVREGTGAGQAHAPTSVPMPDNLELYVSRNVVVPLGGARDVADARPGEQGNGGGQPPSRGVDLPRPQLLVPHVQAQQGIIASQETELTSVEGNNPDQTLTRSQRYSPIEQERNNRLMAEQHSVLPAAETTQTAPTIRVTIGRIDVRAIPGPAPAPSSKPAKRSPALSLDDYLKQGKGERQ